MEGTLVSAVMITGKPDRQALAQAAIDAYLAQTHVNRELIIVDDSAAPLRIPRAPRIRLVRTEPNRVLGDLRNIGLAHAQGDVLIQWDDDDWYHPERISYQLSKMLPGKASLLRYQLRHDLTCNRTILWRWRYPECPGIPGTMMFPNESGLRFRSEGKHEDTHFLQDHFQDRCIVAENSDFQQCYTRIYHGKNTWSQQHVMGTETQRPSADAAAYIQKVISQRYQAHAENRPAKERAL